MILSAERAGKYAPRALTEHEPDRLDDRHEPENDADGAACAVPETPHERRVHKVVDVGHEHGDDRGYRKLDDQPRNGRFGHHVVLRNSGLLSDIRFCLRSFHQEKAYLLLGSTLAIAPAKLFMGIVCRTTLPGPVTTVLKRLSPPNSTFFTPETVLTSIVQVASIMAR